MIERVTSIVWSIGICCRIIPPSLSMKGINSFDLYVVYSFFCWQRSRCSTSLSTSLLINFRTLRIRQMRSDGILKSNLMRDWIYKSSFSKILKPIKAICMQSWILLNLALVDSESYGNRCCFNISVHLTSDWLTVGVLVNRAIRSCKSLKAFCMNWEPRIRTLLVISLTLVSWLFKLLWG